MKFQLSLLAGLIFFSFAAVAAELQLVFERHTGVTEQEPGKLSLSEPETYILRLGETYFYWITGKRQEVIDLKTERHMIFVDEKKIQDNVLSAIVVERHQKLLKGGERARLMQSLDMEIDKRTSQPLFELEHRLGMSAGIPLATMPQNKHVPPNGTVYLLDGRICAEYSIGKHRIPKAFRDMWARWLAYECPTHPKLRKTLLVHRTFPERITVRHRKNRRVDHLHFALKSVELVTDSSYTAAKRKQRVQSSPVAIEQMAIDMRTKGTLPDRPSAAQFNQSFQNAFDQQRYSEALLCAMEVFMQEGTNIEAAVQTLQPAIEQDPQLMSLASGLDTSTHNKAVQSEKTLKSLRFDSFARSHILYALLGDAYRGQKKYAEAEKSYFAALKVNPYLTSVYANLGQVYLDAGLAGQAFTAWSLAVDVNAEHPVIRAPLSLIRKVHMDHPDFFLPTK